MDGMLNLLSTALEGPGAKTRPVQADSTSTASATLDGAVATDALEGNGAVADLQADLHRRANVKIQKAVSEMDKYELARHRAELRLLDRSNAQPDAHGHVPDGAQSAADKGQPRNRDGSMSEHNKPAAGVPASKPLEPDVVAEQKESMQMEAGREIDATERAPKRRADDVVLSAAKERYLSRKNARQQGT